MTAFVDATAGIILLTTPETFTADELFLFRIIK